jgi:DNA-binding CsgD family transcriptional regulator
VLVGRLSEAAVLDELIQDVRTGHSRALVIDGEPGIGKTALLDYAVSSANDFDVARAVGVESEMELAFAALHQLCAAMLDRLDQLPDPQRDALGTAFGLKPGPTPDRFLVGLAVLSLLSEAATDRPLLCVIDDAQWLDQASGQALAFVGRRLAAESIAVMLATRDPSEEFAQVEHLTVSGLNNDAARELLQSVVRGPLDERIRHRIIAETHGNPLALLELPRGLGPVELAGGFALPNALPLSDRIQATFLSRLESAPPEAQLLLRVAAAEPAGDPLLVWRVADHLNLGKAAMSAAEETGLVEFANRVRFRHPLVRSAIYGAASADQRRVVHGALAEATDPEQDPDRRAWHRAQACQGPDEDVASELERSAGRANARGGLAAAAAFLEQATVLTPDREERARRALRAARAKFEAGAFDAARDLLLTAESGAAAGSHPGEIDLLRAQMEFAAGHNSLAPGMLLAAAKRMEPVDADAARATYLDALSAAMFVGRLAEPGSGLLDVSRAVLGADLPRNRERAPDLLLHGWALNFAEGYAAGARMLRHALDEFGKEMSEAEELRRLWLAHITALHLWDDERWDQLSQRYVDLARRTGAIGELPVALASRVYVDLLKGDVNTAASLDEEADAAAEATGTSIAPYGALGIAALRGDEAGVAAAAEATGDVVRRGEGSGVTVSAWALAALYNGLGVHDKALAAAQEASAHAPDVGAAVWGLVELVEAAARSGKPEAAGDAARRLANVAETAGSDWALGISARSQALLSDGATAESLYREAVDRLGRCQIRLDLARAHLTYGEWLRRERRRGDAREQLRQARALFSAMGTEGFAERTERALRATGERARKRTVETRDDLTAQERQIARLAQSGLSNPEIATRLFISPRTVEYHLSKVFLKLGIRTRKDLDGVLTPSRAAP